MADTWTILSPLAERSAPAHDSRPTSGPVVRPVAGARVGFEIDYAWNCYGTLIDEWTALLERDGASTSALWFERSRRDRARKSPEELRNDLDEWVWLLDCAVVGLGN